MTDVLFISPSNANQTYQALAGRYSAVEPPTWALLLAEACRAKGHDVKIMDCLAENLSDDLACERIIKLSPRIICFVVYGQNVNAGSTNMSGAVRLANQIKKHNQSFPVGFVGSHVQALPQETLEREKSIDFVCLNEGVHSLLDMLQLKGLTANKLSEVRGLAVKTDHGIVFTGDPEVVSGDKMDEMMPGYAWDLLPYSKKPLDLYRSPYWHAEYQDQFRSPYAAIQTSIGCQFKCSFCMINLINKNDQEPEGVASSYAGMRYWSCEFVERQLKALVSMGVKTIRITDEMFLLNKKYYLPLLETLSKLNKNDDLRLWVYSRIDTVPSPEILKKVRNAGIRWLCLGIESGDRSIRLEVAKGKFEEVDVTRVVRQVEDAGINVMANYIYGLPGDTPETVQKTFDLSVDLNTLGWNTYAAMALPGSPLYRQAKTNGQDLPVAYEEFSFHSYETKPLPTENMSAAEILKMRDENFTKYFSRPEFLSKIESAFGAEARANIVAMNKKTLRRKIIETDLTGLDNG